MEFIHQPAPSKRLGDYLKANLCRSWTHFRAAVAFVKHSGTRHIVQACSDFAQTNHVEIIAGIDLHGTSAEGLQDLLDAAAPNGRIIVFHNRMPFTFHPKIYLFKSPVAAELLISSGNLTEGGLFTNYEASLRVDLNLSDPEQAAILQSIEHVLDTWADTTTGTAHILDKGFLDRLIALGLVPLEALMVPNSKGATGSPTSASENKGLDESIDKETEPESSNSPFIARAEPRAPVFPRPRVSQDRSLVRTKSPMTRQEHDLEPLTLGVTGFVMTLQRTDVGVGQTTAGTSRRSPEIFIPLSARDAEPNFWDWPHGFNLDPSRSNKYDRFGVRMHLGAEIVKVNMMTWPDKHDFRLRSEALRSAGNIGDILRMEKVAPELGFEYYVEVIPQGTSQYQIYFALCRQPVRNSKKTYGYY